MTQTRTPRPKSSGEPTKKPFPVLPVIGGVVAVALIATVLLTFSSGAGEFGEATVTGTELGEFGGSPTADPALGATVPDVVGEDFGGTEVTITNDGRPKMLVFLAHWCPHCQSEVPVVSSWLDQGGKPDGVDIYAIATGTSTTRENYPPSAWFEREGLDVPTVVDTEDYTVAEAFGLSAYPFWVFVDGEGRVFARVTGSITAGDLTLIAEDLLG